MMSVSSAVGRFPAEMALLIGECESLARALGCTMNMAGVAVSDGIVRLIAVDDFSKQVHRFDTPDLALVCRIVAAELERRLGDVEADFAQRLESVRCCHA